VTRKEKRQQMLLQNEGCSATIGMVEDDGLVSKMTQEVQPDVIVHLAGQAGVRYSLKNPRSYIDSNIVCTFNIM